MQSGGKNAGEMGVGDGVGGNGIYCAVQSILFDGIANHGDSFIEREPAHPLAAIAEAPSETKTKRWKHALERAAVCGQNDAKAQRNRTDARFLGLQDFGFPVAANLRQEILARCGRFREDFVATTAIKADRGGGNENARLALQFLQAGDKMMRGVDAAAAKNLLARWGPAAFGDGSAGKMNNGIGPFHGREVNRAGWRLPANAFR